MSRQNVVPIAKSLNGLEPDSEDYVRRIYRPQNETQREQARKLAKSQSGCGLVCEAILHEAGATSGNWSYTNEFYGKPSRISFVSRDLVTAAKRDNAWRTYNGADMPHVGDMVLMGGSAEYARGTLISEHWFTITEIEGAKVSSVDGGQPGIHERSRVAVITPQGELWFGNDNSALDATGTPTVGRRVRGWIDTSALSLEEDEPITAIRNIPTPKNQSSSTGVGSITVSTSLKKAFAFLGLAFLLGHVSSFFTREDP